MSDFIPLSVPHLEGHEWDYVKECLDTEWVSPAGRFVNKFEDDICRFTGAKQAVACVNGTAALYISLMIAGVRAGDEVLVPTLTFIATINAVAYLGAAPVFMDCDEFYGLDIEKTVDFIARETIHKNGVTRNKTSGRRIAAVLPVHVFGNAVDLAALTGICGERGIKIIEDATESLGTVYSQGPLAGKHAGAIGDLGCLSFNGNKIITTGGGGMILTDNADHADKARYLTTQAKNDEVLYIHDEIGYNFRLTNIQAALGVAQLEKLPEYLAVKKRNYEAYKRSLDPVPGLHLAETPPYARNNHWMYCLQIDESAYGKNREEIMTALAKDNIQTRPVWYLNHLQKPYRACQTYQIEKAIELWEKTLNIPCSVNLKPGDIERVVALLKK
jgi:aminotransferase in exopolysaccharide biosynthesis